MMEDTHANWNSLPVKVLHKIFKIALLNQPRSQKYEWSLVCRAWKHSAQTALYSCVTMKSLLQLQKFYRTIKLNPQLGGIVKAINFNIYSLKADETASTEWCDLLTTLLTTYLPNLEVLNDSNLHSYVPILNALLDSQLKHLKSLPPAYSMSEKSEVSNYITCALLMRNRLENIFISDQLSYVRGSLEKHLFFQRLYDRLDQFEKVKDITVRQNSRDEIQVLDRIVEACKSLETVDCRFVPPGDDFSPSNKSVSMEAISRYIPRPNIKSLTSYLCLEGDYKLLFYIMHKFSQLYFLSLRIEQTTTARLLDRHVIIQLLHYLYTIEEYDINDLQVHPNDITEALGSFWNAKSEPGNENVSIVYSDIYPDQIPGVLDLSKKSNIPVHSTTLSSPIQNVERLNNDFIEKNGKFIGKFRFTISTDDAPRSFKCKLPENFINHTLTHCPNFQSLHIQGCVLKQLTYTKIDLIKKFLIKELFLDNCIIYDGVLEQLSQILPEIDQLRLSEELVYRTGEQPIVSDNLPDIQYLEIIMPYTKIKDIIFWRMHEPVLFKLHVVTHALYNYYRFDPSDGKGVRVSNELEYLERNNQKHVLIHCITKPNLIFE